jgi:hypothetical protein
MSAEIFGSLTTQVSMSASIWALNQAAFSLSSSTFRLAMAFIAELGAPAITTRAAS